MKLLTPARRRILVASAKWLSLAATIALTLVWLASIRYHAGLTGKPFNRAYSISGGEACVEWFSREPDGSTSGFGNPGWKFRPRDEFWIRWRPHVWTGAAGTHHMIVLPLWPLPLLLAAGAWWLGRLQRHFADSSLCPSCGYSREGLPQTAKCPECGALRKLWKAMLTRTPRPRPTC